MKCFVCRNIGKEQCKACDNQSNFAPKTITDLVAEGVEIFNLKMERPQYAEYKTNKKLRDCLLKDCIREAIFSNSINSKEAGNGVD